MAGQSKTPVGLAVRLLAAASVAGVGIIGGQSVRASGDDTVTVHADSVIRTLPPTFFGINYDTWWDGSQGSAASAAALGQTPIKLVRYPGGVAANWFDWAEPFYDGYNDPNKVSKTSPEDLWNYAQTFGGTALFQTNASQHSQPPNPPNPPLTQPGQTATARQSYAVSSGQNQADWVQYDKAQGIKALMEVGNEQELELCGSCTTDQDPTYQPYIDTFKQQAKAIHQADSTSQVIGPAQSNEWYWWHQHMLTEFLAQVGDKNNPDPLSRPDGISLHIYNGSQWEDTLGLAQDWLNSVWPNGIVAQITANDSRPLPVYITEWNNGAGSNDWYNPTIGHGLVTADMIGAFAESGGPGKPSVAGEVYWDMHRTYGGYGMLNTGDQPSPTYFAMALWGKMGPQVLSLSQSMDPASTVSTYATRKPDGSIQVMAINKQATAQPLQLGFDGNFAATGAGYQVYEMSSFPTGGDTAVYPNYDKGTQYDGMKFDGFTTLLPPALPGAIARGTLSGGTLSYNLDPYSAIVFDIAPAAGGPGTPTPTATISPTATATASPTATATATSTATSTSTSTATATNTATSTATSTRTATATATATGTAIAASNTATGTATSTATATATRTATSTATATATNTPIAAKTMVPPTNTVTATSTVAPPTATSTATHTAVPSTSTSTAVSATATRTSTMTPVPATSTHTPVPLTATPVPATATPSGTLAKGLVGYWRFDGGSGAIAADASGAGNACALHAGATWSSGHFGGAISLDGKSGYLSCGVATLPAANAPQSISWWMNLPGSPSGVQNVLALTNDPARSAVQPGFRNGTFGVWKYGGTFLVTAPAPSTRTWHHVAYTFDGTTHRLYVDGTLRASATTAPQTAHPSKLEIGRWTGGSEYLRGTLDDIRLYNRALSAAEVAALAGQP